MKITKVTYQKTYSIGPYLTDRVGFEADLSEDWARVEGELKWETPEMVLSNLRKMADEWHKKENQHLYEERIVPTTKDSFFHEPTSPSPIINIQHEKIQIAIENAKTLDELKDIKTVHPLLPVPLMEVYNKRLKELSV